MPGSADPDDAGADHDDLVASVATHLIGRSIQMNVGAADDAAKALGLVLDEGAERGGRSRDCRR
jgi:hypothetical protein